MAPSHVPNDHHPLQGQTIYTDPAYEHLFSRVNQYNAPSWDQFNQSHSALNPQTSGAQSSWHQNSLPQQSFNSPGQQYGNANSPYQTPSSFQYAQYNSHAPPSNYGHQPTIDPSLGQDPVALRQQQQSPYQPVHRNVTPQGQQAVTPRALQQSGASLVNARPSASPFPIPKSTTEMFAQRTTPTSSLAIQPVSNPKYEVPKGKASGGVSLIDQAALAKATQSSALNKLVNLGTVPMHLASNRTALPIYNARQSVKELKKAGAQNRKILDKLAKKPSSARKILLSKSGAAGRINPGSPSALQRGVSDSESYSDSSDESDYTDDGEDEPSPLPSSRPDEPHEAVRYDVIKALWLPRNSRPSSEKIKACLRDFWEVANTIQRRWRIDSRAVTDAEEQKKTGELPVPKSRVASQRDLLQTALKSALEFGHSDVVYQFGHVKPFLYLCYQFLANRFKLQDYDGGLSSVICQILARGAGTLTNELIEETKLVKALNSMKKNANDTHKALIQQILDGADAGSKKPKVASPPGDEVVEPKNVKRPATQGVGNSSAEGIAAKKLKTSESVASPAKKSATVAPGAKMATTATMAGLQKRPGEKPAAQPVKARGNQVVNKSSAFFSTLNAATKKPTPAAAPVASSKPSIQTKPTAASAKEKKPVSTAPPKQFSFMETMASLLKPKEEAAAPVKTEKRLPPETPEQKAKRLRKESRRHLRVTFRPDATLTSIRYFHHDPEEEAGHDENFVRDVGDIGGEGRMFKQHRELEEDDDDEDAEVEYRPWREPSVVDQSVVDPQERERNYEPFGGGAQKPECPEKEANIRREKPILSVYYTHPSDIPPSPREPLEPEMPRSTPPKELGAPPQFVLDRSPKAPAPAPDFSSLESMINQLASATAPTQPAAPQSTYAPAQPTAAPASNLADILKSLQGSSNPQATAPAIPPLPAAGLAVPPLPNAPLGGVDLSALFSVMQQAQAAPAPTAVPFGAMPPGWPAFPPAFQQPQQQTSPGYQQPPAQHGEMANGGTKRQRDEGNNNNNERGHGSFKKHRGNKTHQYTGDRPHKVIPCKFFQQGKCTKGDECTFIHDRNF